MLNLLSLNAISFSLSISTLERNVKVPLVPMLSAKIGKITDWFQHLSIKLKLSLLKVMMQNFTKQNGLHSLRMPLSIMTFPLFKSKERCVSSFSIAMTTYLLINGVHHWLLDVTLLLGYVRIATPTSRRRRQVRTCLKTARTTINCSRSMDLIMTLSRLSLAMSEVSSNNEKTDPPLIIRLLIKWTTHSFGSSVL